MEVLRSRDPKQLEQPRSSKTRFFGQVGACFCAVANPTQNPCDRMRLLVCWSDRLQLSTPVDRMGSIVSATIRPTSSLACLPKPRESRASGAKGESNNNMQVGAFGEKTRLYVDCAAVVDFRVTCLQYAFQKKERGRKESSEAKSATVLPVQPKHVFHHLQPVSDNAGDAVLNVSSVYGCAGLLEKASFGRVRRRSIRHKHSVRRYMLMLHTSVGCVLYRLGSDPRECSLGDCLVHTEAALSCADHSR